MGILARSFGIIATASTAFLAGCGGQGFIGSSIADCGSDGLTKKPITQHKVELGMYAGDPKVGDIFPIAGASMSIGPLSGPVSNARAAQVVAVNDGQITYKFVCKRRPDGEMGYQMYPAQPAP